MIRNRLINTVDKWFVYFLPWICIGSFFTKKHLLVVCGALALLRMLLQKKGFLFWRDWLVFFLLNAWLLIAAFRVSFIGVPLTDVSGGLQAYDFNRSFLISLAFFVCAEDVVQRIGLQQAFRVFSIAILTFVGLFVAFILISEPSLVFKLYSTGWRFNYWLGWGFDDICGMIGLWFFVMVASKRNKIFDWVLYLAGFLLFLSLGRRPTIFYALLLLLYLSKDLIYQLKSNYRKQLFLGCGLGGVFAFVYLLFNSDIGAYLKGLPLIQRILSTVDGGWTHEGRFFLVRTFLDKFEFFGFFGGNVNAAYFTGGFESFHNLLLDALWYGGWIGGLLVLLGLTLLVLQCVYSSTYIAFLMMFSIISGLLMAAPPFSNQFAFALVLPLFLRYLRSERSNKLIHI